MKTNRRRVFIVFAFLSALLFGAFAVLEHELESVHIVEVNVWFISPFVLLLASIAVMPFINRHWWEKNYPNVAFALGFIVVFYYLYELQNGPRLLLTSYEYVSFISLIGSLFVVAGGIHIRIRGKASPLENVGLLGTGAVISNFLGTTGASMILIRPYLRTNKYRIRPYHVVFFIFIVSNIGGALTPIGDPPLFLGYLKGVPFFWIITRVSHIWALTVGLVLLAFFVIDYYNFEKEKLRMREAAAHVEEPEVNGLHNIVFLLMILGAVFIEKPIMLREIVMWWAALASYYTTKEDIHKKNEFNFIPIKEVAILFAGIFATMIPALDWLELNAEKLGVVTPAQYFWGTGVLSSFLDNAPTYLNFLSAAFGLHGANVDNLEHMNAMLGLASTETLRLSNPLQPGAFPITGETWRYVQAISLGAVFFGANTYIGNGPNFMVKSIAEQAHVECPSFFGYVAKYTIPVLVPIFVIVWYFFFT
ncbi:MAG: sodium:proton antiporter [Ignavibacteriales bacterium]|nr:sodium:proton antiporter [Ignavibacteriales bacterium]